jgi:hypothetical protein
MIGLGLSGGFAEQAITLVGLAGVDQYVGGLNRMQQGWNAVDAAQTRASRSGELLQRLGFGLTAGLTGSTVAFLATTTKMGMASVELQNLVEQSFRSSTQEIINWSNVARQQFGLNSRDMRREASVLMSIFRGAGIEGDVGKSLSKMLVDAKNDMVSIYGDAMNVTDKEVFQALQSGVTGETEPLKRFGIMLNEETVKQYAYKNGIAAANSELSEQQKILARIGFIMERLKENNVIGDLARTKNSPANQRRRLINEFNESLQDFGEKAIPIANDVLKIGKDFLPYLKQGVEWFGKLDETSRKWVIGFALGIGPVTWGLGKILSLVRGAKDVVGAVTGKGGAGGANVATMTVNAAVVNINGGGFGGGRGFPSSTTNGPNRLPGGGAGAGAAGRAGWLSRLWNYKALVPSGNVWANSSAGLMGRLFPAGISAFGMGTAATVGTIAAGAYSAYKLPGLMRDASTLSDEEMRKKGPWERGIQWAGRQVGDTNWGANIAENPLDAILRVVMPLAPRMPGARWRDYESEWARGDAAEKKSASIVYNSEGQRELRRLRQFHKEAEAETSAFFERTYGKGSAYAKAQVSDSRFTITNAKPEAEAVAVRENWDERTRAVADLFGLGPDASGTTVVGSAKRGRDGGVQVSYDIPPGPGEKSARDMRFVVNTPGRIPM